jgi:hypothetical protein
MREELISRIEDIASQISQKIEKVTGLKDQHLPPFHIDHSIYDDKSNSLSEVVLVVGLNPSASDIDKGGENIDRLLMYIPEIDGNLTLFC